MKTISINGYVLDCPLMADDPEVKRSFRDASGEARHVRFFSQPGKLKSYVSRHPEGIILAGAGSFFFTEPVPVTSSMIRFDENGSVNIVVREGAEEIQRQLSLMEDLGAVAAGISDASARRPV